MNTKQRHLDSVKKYRRSKKGLTSKIYSNQMMTSRKRGHNQPEYNSKQLRDWLFQHPNFNKLYSDWKNSGYDKMLVPSIDRLDDCKGYSFNNIQLMTWQENKDKSHLDIISGKNNYLNKTVIQYDLNNVFIAEYHSINNARRITKIKHISCACRGVRKTAGGYKWEFKNIKL